MRGGYVPYAIAQSRRDGGSSYGSRNNRLTQPPNYPTTSRPDVWEDSGESGVDAYRKAARFP